MFGGSKNSDIGNIEYFKYKITLYSITDFHHNNKKVIHLLAPYLKKKVEKMKLKFKLIQKTLFQMFLLLLFMICCMKYNIYIYIYKYKIIRICVEILILKSGIYN